MSVEWATQPHPYHLLASPPVRAAENVDIERYMGLWYEIARLPNWFEKEGCYDVQARYTLLDEKKGRFEIENTCVLPVTHALQCAKGIGRVVGPGQAQVSFLPLVPFWLSSGAYWILETDHSYYSLVGDPARAHLWILCRERPMAEHVLQRLVEKAREIGYDVSRLQRSG